MYIGVTVSVYSEPNSPELKIICHHLVQDVTVLIVVSQRQTRDYYNLTRAFHKTRIALTHVKKDTSCILKYIKCRLKILSDFPFQVSKIHLKLIDLVLCIHV